jgi:hypothetical protein
MSKQNIWEIVTVNDLVKILKEHENRFCIVALTLQETPENDVKMIKKFLKDYSKIYKNLTFLYLKLTDKDLGRISIIKKDKEEYPFIYHIYNITDIFVSVNRVNKQTLYESMNAVEKYYKKDLENMLHDSQPLQNNNVSNKSVIQTNTLNLNKNNINLNQNNNDENDNQEEINEEQEIQNKEDMQRRVLEHENLLNKLIIFEEKKKQHNLKFLEDIQKRKKEEKIRR